MTVPTLDFLFSKITDVHFGYAVYMLITGNAHETVAGFSAPAPPSVSASGPLFVDKSRPVTTDSYTPPAPVTTKYFFIWPDAAVFPTADTIGENVGLGIPYGGQFSVVENINSGGFGTVHPPGANTEGFYASIDAAQAGATFQNNSIRNNLAGPYTIEWFVPGATMGPSSWTGFNAYELDVVTLPTGPGSGSSSAQQQFLFGPLPVGSYGWSVNFGVSGSDYSAGVSAALIFTSAGKVTSIATFPGGITAAGANGGGRATGFSVTASVGATPDSTANSVSVDFSGGGGGGQ